MQTQTIPRSSVDIFCDEVLTDPYPVYAELRDMGPVVYLEASEAYALTRYDDVRRALIDWESFPSEKGLAFNQTMNDFVTVAKTVLTLDPPEHHKLRATMLERMSPRAVRSSATDPVYQKVYDVVAKQVARGSFDAVTDLAHPLVADLIGEILGFSSELSNQFRVGSTAMFACLGPLNEHGSRGLPIFQEMIQAVAGLTKDDLRPGSYGRALYEAGERGDVDPQSCGMLILNYAGPAYDTTIMAVTSLIWLFARHPEQWQRVCDDPSLIPSAREEAIRIESPFQTWGRWCRKESTFGDSTIPAESHVAILAGSANRDGRHYPDPDTFDVGRNPRDHLGFGVGVHNCVGAPLARLEIEAILRALAEQKVTLALDGEPKRSLANLVRGFDRLPVRVV